MIRSLFLLSVPLLAIAAAAQEPTVRLLDISALLSEAPVTDPPAAIEPNLSGLVRGGEDAHTETRAQEQPFADLERFVRTFIDPALDENEDVRVLGRKYLAVLGRPAQHAWAETLLAQQGNSRQHAFKLEIRVLETSREVFEERFLPWFGTANPQQKMQKTLAPAPAVDQWLAEVLHDERINARVAPRVLALPLYACALSVGDPLRYVRDYEVEFVGEQPRPIAKPIMDDLWDGILITATCASLPDGTIGVDFEYKATTVQRPIPQFTTSLAGDDTPLTIDLPTATTVHLQQRLALPNGGIAILCAQSDADHYAIALVRVELQPR